MNATIKLLDKYAQICAIKQDKDLAARLRVTKQAVSGWRNGRAHPDADSVARMCEATGEPVAHWLPLIEAERARNPEARKVWLRLAQMAAAITLIVGVFGPSSAHAEGQAQFREIGPHCILCQITNQAIRRLRRLGTRLASSLRSLFGTEAGDALQMAV